ncbi:MAG: Uma2 family endonuclease [Nodosilinea sp.]
MSLVAKPITLKEYLDYTEYAGRRIPEYWIVDPIADKVTVLEWVEGLYEEQVYAGEQAIGSPQFPDLDLIASTVLSARR